MSDEELESECGSVDSICVEEVLEMDLDDDGHLAYLCRTNNGDEVIDRSDLMDGAKHQQLVMTFERRHPPPWDDVCTFCAGEGCEECICEECERPCRHIKGINYGCCKHPVI